MVTDKRKANGRRVPRGWVAWVSWLVMAWILAFPLSLSVAAQESGTPSQDAPSQDETASTPQAGTSDPLAEFDPGTGRNCPPSPTGSCIPSDTSAAGSRMRARLST